MYLLKDLITYYYTKDVKQAESLGFVFYRDKISGDAWYMEKLTGFNVETLPELVEASILLHPYLDAGFTYFNLFFSLYFSLVHSLPLSQLIEAWLIPPRYEPGLTMFRLQSDFYVIGVGINLLIEVYHIFLFPNAPRFCWIDYGNYILVFTYYFFGG